MSHFGHANDGLPVGEAAFGVVFVEKSRATSKEHFAHAACRPFALVPLTRSGDSSKHSGHKYLTGEVTNESQLLFGALTHLGALLSVLFLATGDRGPHMRKRLLNLTREHMGLAVHMDISSCPPGSDAGL